MSVAIWWWGCVEWWLKKFGCHLTHPTIHWWPNFFDHQEKRHVICLWKPFITKRGVWKQFGCCKVDDQKLLVAVGLKFFNRRKIGDRNPFSIAICNEGCMNVNKKNLCPSLQIQRLWQTCQDKRWHDAWH